MSLSVKVFLNEHRQVRRWKISSFSDLVEKVERITEGKFKFEYLDNDLEWIVLETDDEWCEAVSVATSSKDINPLIVRVVMLKNDSKFGSLRKHSRCTMHKKSTSCAPNSSDNDITVEISRKGPLKRSSTPIESIVSQSVSIVPEGENTCEEINVNKNAPTKGKSIEITQVDDAATIAINRKTSPKVLRKIEIDCESNQESQDKKDTVKAYTVEEPEMPSSPRYSSEESLLQSMGFKDKKLNFHLLNHHNGSLEKTITCLLQVSP